MNCHLYMSVTEEDKEPCVNPLNMLVQIIHLTYADVIQLVSW
jgi:hypothetical protein